MSTRVPLLLDTRGGLGDNIYARPFVRAYAAAGEDVIVRTPWPQLFRDLRVEFQSPGDMGLRTQRYNVARLPHTTWSGRRAGGAVRKHFWYRLQKPGVTILQDIEKEAGWPEGQPFVFDLPNFPKVKGLPRRYALIRPVSLRVEWLNRARNPRADYVATAADMLREAGYTVVSVADIDGKYEYAIDPLPEADVVWNKGERTVEELMALVENAAVVVGGVGWIVPACMAYGTPAVVIGGGNGAHNAPEVVTDPRVDCSRMRFILPDNYCRCSTPKHGCNKVIRDFDAQFAAALDSLAPAQAAA